MKAETILVSRKMEICPYTNKSWRRFEIYRIVVRIENVFRSLKVFHHAFLSGKAWTH